jgi:drug/metabolite transporter (DMT)-like permease
LSNQLWIFMIPFYYWMKKKEFSKYIVQYSGMGLLIFSISLLRSIGANILPGSLFSLLISTSILFTMGLRWFWLKKKITSWHISAGFCCVCSAICICVDTKGDSLADSSFVYGVAASIGAAFFVALSGAWQEKIQSTWDDFNLRIIEMTIAASVLASLLLVLVGMCTREFLQWTPTLVSATQTSASLALIIGSSLALPILKLLVRNTKYSIIQVSSSFFFEFIQASSALLGSLSNILLFNEPWGLGYIGAFLFLGLAFVFYSIGNMKTKKVVIVNPKVLEIENPIQLRLEQQGVKVVVSVWK